MRPTEALIHLDNLRHNIRIIKRMCPDTKICAAVKANAYGHGALEVSKVLQDEDVSFLAVATTEEAVELKKGGILTPVLLLGLTLPDDYAEIIRREIHPVVADKEAVKALAKEARLQNKTVSVHLKLDTGMGRIGCPPHEAAELAELISISPGLNLEGVCTHLACADSSDKAFSEHQISLFNRAVDEIRSKNIDPGLLHCANSAAILNIPQSGFNMIRPGILLYGYPPADNLTGSEQFKRVMELKTRIVFLKKTPPHTSISYGATYETSRETWIATLPVGYADGYPRLLSGKAKVVIKGKHHSVIGRICMDQMIIEVSEDTELYDEVTLIGIHPEEPGADTLAALSGTICYEILTGISSRVLRTFTGN